MVTRAVLFDWFNTLADYDPPRHEAHADACRALGIEVAKERLSPGILLADHYYVDENRRSPVKQRPIEEQMAIFSRMEHIALREAGVQLSDDQALGIIQKMAKVFADTRFSLYEDVLPAFDLLKERGLILGVISNIDRDLVPVCQELGLAPYLDLIITSRDTGYEKPDPRIFQAALQHTGTEGSETIYVGDHHAIDVLAAEQAGMQGVLLDRFDLFGHITSCPRITSLVDLVHYV